MAMGQELDNQNVRLDQLDQKTVNLDNKIVRNTERVCRTWVHLAIIIDMLLFSSRKSSRLLDGLLEG
jgi:hypothetical protein